MPVLNTQQELRNGKKYDTLTSNRLKKISIFETNDIRNTHRGNIDSDSEKHILAQEAVDKPINDYIAPLAN